MKRLFLLPALAAAVLLLSACPDTKLPTPTTPKVPEPKAAASMFNRHAPPLALNSPATEASSSRLS
ncbi:MAG: hypothetical protein ABIV07_06035 [Polaromonas sp.]